MSTASGQKSCFDGGPRAYIPIRRKRSEHVGSIGRGVKDHNQPRPAYSVCWRFVNFDDIFLGLFDGDSASILASAPTRAAESSKVTTSSDKMWQSFLFSEQQWTV